MTKANGSEYPAGTQWSGSDRERSRSGMREFSPQAETRDMEIAATREQARKLRIENDGREAGKGDNHGST